MRKKFMYIFMATFVKPLWNKPLPPVFSWNISEFFRATILQGTCVQLFQLLVQFNQTIQEQFSQSQKSIDIK